MLMTVSKFLYALTALVFADMIIYGKLFVFKKRKPQFVSDYCATMAGILGVYTVLSMLLAGLFPSASAKMFMFAFALSPFVIGLFATYHTEKYFTVLQVLLLIISTAYVVL